MNSLVMEGFQYPENPEWSVREDEVQDMIDRINGAKRLWPLLRVVRAFVPLFRDILCGFIAEEDKPVGLINYMRQKDAPEWYIANVTVLPAYRRRGMARRLVATTLQELRHRKARVAFLNVVTGNDPALNLYKEMGFKSFTESSDYDFQRDTPMIAPLLPEGYKLRPLSRFDWQSRFAFARRVIPDHITSYEPVLEGRFRTSVIMPLFEALFESAGGSHSERFAIYTANDEIVGLGQYSYRTRPGGTNSTKLSIDPRHPKLAEFILCHVFSTIQRESPDRRIELSLEDWESELLQCAEEMGCEKRLGYHRMGLRF